MHYELVATKMILRAPPLSGPNRTFFVNMAADMIRDMELMINRAEEANVASKRASRMDSANVMS